MLSKFLRPYSAMLCATRPPQREVFPRPSRTRLVPLNQYEVAVPQKLRLLHAITVYWELVPLLFVTCLSLSLMIASILSAINNKVDVVFTSRSRDNISRTMNLRRPSVHRLVTINQRYDPWPELQDVLDKMAVAEKRALTRAVVCYP